MQSYPLYTSLTRLIGWPKVNHDYCQAVLAELLLQCQLYQINYLNVNSDKKLSMIIIEASKS